MRTNLASAESRRLTRRGLKRRKDLLEAAMTLFAEVGFDGATTKAIAERSGVTEAVVFRYFPTKHDLFHEVVKEYGPSLHYPMDHQALRDLPFAEGLISLISGYLDHIWHRRQSMKLFLLGTLYDTGVSDTLLQLFEFRLQKINEMVEERIEKGELKADAREYGADVVTLSTTGFLVRCLRREPADWDRARDQFVRGLTRTVSRGLVAET